MLVPPYVPDDLLDEGVVGVHKAEGGDVGAPVSEVLQVHQVQVLHHVLLNHSHFKVLFCLGQSNDIQRKDFVMTGRKNL